MITACDGVTNYIFEGKGNPYNRAEDTVSNLEEVQNLLESASSIVFHNAKFDLHMMESIGINLEPLWDKVEDTILMHHTVSSGESHALKYLAFKYMNMIMKTKIN